MTKKHEAENLLATLLTLLWLSLM